MADNNPKLFEKEYWTWGTDQGLWTPFLADVRTKVSLAARKVKSAQAMAKEINNPANTDNLSSTQTNLEDLQDFESTVTETYIQALASDPNNQETLRAKQTAM